LSRIIFQSSKSISPRSLMKSSVLDIPSRFPNIHAM
jgi:hypothetical protein